MIRQQTVGGAQGEGATRRFRPRQVNVSGGEPLVSPDWPEVAAIAKRLGYRVTLTTNGSFLARELDPEKRSIRKAYEDRVQAPVAVAQERLARVRFAVLSRQRRLWAPRCKPW